MLTATVVALLFVIAGEFLLDAFHVSMPALKLGGGLLLVLFALEMVLGSKSPEAPKTALAASTNIAVYPLAMPLMVTPQGLVAIVTLTAGAPGYRGVGDLPRVRNGLGVAVISTNRGVLTDEQARGLSVGGEVLCEIW